MTKAAWIILLAVAFFGLFLGPELYAMATHTITFSEAMAAWNDRWPPLSYCVVFAAGVLVGHWWWPLRVEKV